MNVPAVLKASALAAALVLATLAPGPRLEAAPARLPAISEAVELALRESAQAAIARSQLEAAAAAGANLEAALLGWRLDAVLEETVNRSELLPSLPNGDPLNTFTAALSVRKALGVSGTTALALEESRIQRERAEREYEASLRDIAVTAFEAYRQLELALVQQRVLERAVELSQKSLEVAKSQAELGAAAETKVREASLAYEEAVQRRDGSRRLFDIAWQRLARLLGLAAGSIDALEIEAISVERALDMIESRHPAFWPDQPLPWSWSLDELIALAQENRPETQSAREGVALAKLGVEKVKLDARPDVQFTASATWPEKVRASLTLDDEWVAHGSLSAWRYNHQEFQPGQEPIPAPKNDVDWSIGVRVTVNLWDGGASRTAALRAERLVEQAELGLDEARHAVALDVQRRYAELQTAWESLLIASRRVEAARLSVANEASRAALGMSSELEIDSAELNLWQAAAGAISARFDYELALLRLAAAVALDLETFREIVRGLEGW